MSEEGTPITEEYVPQDVDPDENPLDWSPVENLAAVVMQFVPLQKQRHKDGRERVIERLPRDRQETSRLYLPQGLTHALALKAAGEVFFYYFPKSPTAAKALCEQMEALKNGIHFTHTVDPNGNAIPGIFCDAAQAEEGAQVQARVPVQRHEGTVN